MAKRNRQTRPAAVVEVPEPEGVAEEVPAVDGPAMLPETASEALGEPGMPEAAKEVPGSSDAAATEPTPETVEKASGAAEADPEEDEETKSNDTVQLVDEIQESVDHDTQELSDDPEPEANERRVEEVKEQDRKRPLEEEENDDVIPAKMPMSDVGTNVPVETIRGEE